VIEAIPASNDVNLPGLATTETLTRHVNLNYFSEAVSWEGEERLADADSWRITGNPQVIGSSVGLVSINALLVRESGTGSRFSPRNGGRVPWRKADVNAPRRQSSNYPI
jgi:hypothetical protein